MVALRSKSLFGAVVAAFALAAAPLTPAGAAQAVLVKIDNFAFSPQELEIKAGTAVTFENDDDIPHLVVATDHSFRSKALDTGDGFTITLEKPGRFPYFCGLHPHMQGSITVLP